MSSDRPVPCAHAVPLIPTIKRTAKTLVDKRITTLRTAAIGPRHGARDRASYTGTCEPSPTISPASGYRIGAVRTALGEPADRASARSETTSQWPTITSRPSEVAFCLGVLVSAA